MNIFIFILMFIAGGITTGLLLAWAEIVQKEREHDKQETIRNIQSRIQRNLDDNWYIHEKIMREKIKREVLKEIKLK